MSQPLVVDLPHSLGQAEAHRRIDANIDRLQNHIPGPADVQTAWEGERLKLAVGAMGQSVTAHIDVHDSFVRLEVLLPPFLAFFGDRIAGLLRAKGPELLEDRSKKG